MHPIQKTNNKAQFLKTENQITLSKTPSPIRNFPKLTRQTTSYNNQKTENSLSRISLDKQKKLAQGYIPSWLTSRDDFSSFLQNNLKNSKNIDQICAQHPSSRSTSEKKSVGKWVYSLEFFKKMPKNLVYETCEYLTTKIFKAGDFIIKKGGQADCMFIIYSGTAGIYIDGKKVAERSAGQVIGETALDSDRPRNADVKGESVVITLQLMKIYYTNKILHFKRHEKLMNKRILAKIQFFSKWSTIRIESFTDYLVTSNYKDGQVLYEEESDSLNLFIVQQGSIIIQKKIFITKVNKWPTGVKNWETQKVNRSFLYNIGTLKAGDIFGVEVFTNQTRLTRAISEGNSSCLILNKPDCSELFSSSEKQKLITMGPAVPDTSAMQSSVHNKLEQRSEKTKVLFDALELNYKDWGGRETDIEKRYRKKTRYLTSIRP